MIISHRHKFLYIAPVKCASTTLRKALAPFADINSNHYGDKPDSFYYNNWHVTAKDLKPHFDSMGWDWDTYFKFSFVRNPWSRLVSGFNYQKKVVYLKEKCNVPHVSYEKYKRNTKHDSFNQWLRRGVKLQYFNFLADEHNNILVDFVGKVENLQHDFQIVCDKIGIPYQQLPRLNKTNHKHYTEYYDDTTRELVAEKCAQDIETFGYKFGE